MTNLISNIIPPAPSQGGGVVEGVPDLQAVTSTGAVTVNQVTFNSGITTTAITPVAGQVSLNGNFVATGDISGISLNTHTIPAGSGTIALTTDLFSGNYNDLTNKPTIFSGNYDDLTNKPTIPSYNEVYMNFGTSTSFNPGIPAVSAGNVMQHEDGTTGDIQLSSTVSSGYTKVLITLDAIIWNHTDSTTEAQVALERQINTGSWTVLRQLIFPNANGFYGSQFFQYIDTHGASTGDTVKYRIRNSMNTGYGSESLRLVTGICGDTFGIKEVE